MKKSMEDIDIAGLKKNVKRKLIIYNMLIQILVAATGTFFVNLYDPTLNLPVFFRLAMIKGIFPMMMGATFSFATSAFSFRFLKPLWFALDMKKEQRTEAILQNAKNRLLKFYMIIFIVNILLWMIGVSVYYAIPSLALTITFPFYLNFMIRFSEGLWASLLTVLMFDNLLSRTKMLLSIRHFDMRKADIFLKYKNILIPLITLVVMATHSLVTQWYYVNRNLSYLGPSMPTISAIFLCTIVLIYIIALSLLSYRQDATQRDALNRQVSMLASDREVDLTQRVNITNFDDTGKTALYLNGYLNVLQNMISLVWQSTKNLKESLIKSVEYDILEA